MKSIHPYIRLMRLHQRAGAWLLFWPCCWAILMTGGLEQWHLLALFALGSLVMRAAGCIVNDIVDRDFDRQVERTRTRPLASGEVSMMQAFILLATLLIIAFIIALQMNHEVFIMAASSLLLVAAYPFMKRITWWPQLFLGITFNSGALIAWAAVKGYIELSSVLLYVGGIFWTLGYDTIYAHQDKEDDAAIGVKSTARYLGTRSRLWIAVFYALTTLCWIAAGQFYALSSRYYLGMGAVAAHFVWQVMQVKFEDGASCMYFFRSNVWLGLLQALAILIAS